MNGQMHGWSGTYLSSMPYALLFSTCCISRSKLEGSASKLHPCVVPFHCRTFTQFVKVNLSLISVFTTFVFLRLGIVFLSQWQAQVLPQPGQVSICSTVVIGISPSPSISALI